MQSAQVEKLKSWWHALLESLPFVAFFVVLFFTMYSIFGVEDALLGIAFLFFSRSVVQEPGLSAGNFLRRAAWYFVMAVCATLAGFHPVSQVLVTAVYLFVIVLLHSDDYLPRNFFWLGMGYLLLLIYPVAPEGFGMRVAATLISIGMTSLFVYGIRKIYRKTGKIDEVKRDREHLLRAFDDVGDQLRALSTWGMKSEAGLTEGDVHPRRTFSVVQSYARLEYPCVFRQGGLLSGRQSYAFALLLCCEQVAYMAYATLQNISHVKMAERRYFEDLSAVFLDYGRGHILTVSQMETRLRQFLRDHELKVVCHEEAWSGILEAMLRTLGDTRMSRDNRTSFSKSVRYRLRYLRENVSLRNTQTRFALQMAFIVGLVGMTACEVLTLYFDALFAMWIPITAFTILNTYNDETVRSTVNTAVGTLAGIVVFALFVHFIPAELRMYIVVPISYLVILMNFNQATSVAAGTQMALIALYPYTALSVALVSRLLLVIGAVLCVMLVIFVFMRTRRTATIRTKVAELERIDGRLAAYIHDAVESGNVNLWRSVQLLYYLHMDSWLLESVASSLGRQASLRDRRRMKEDPAFDRLRADVDRVLGVNFQFAMSAAHAVMLLDPRRVEDDQDCSDSTARFRHIEATADRLDEKIARLEGLRYLASEGAADERE